LSDAPPKHKHEAGIKPEGRSAERGMESPEAMTMDIFKTFGATALALTLATGGWAQDTSTNRVSANTDWSVFVEDDPVECWSVSTPKEIVNTRDGREVAARRGQILLMVFYRPSADAEGQVAFTGGYPFASGSTVNVDIDGTEFEMFAGTDDPSTSEREDEWAWLPSASDDAKMVTAMKRGAQAVVTGLSSRGTTTRDTFSLLGFTAALEDAEARCTS
jgi:hypothetical protein